MTNQTPDSTDELRQSLKKQVMAARIDELEQRVPRLQVLLKSNSDVGTGDTSGFNAGVNAALRADDIRIAELRTAAARLGQEGAK